MKVDNNALPYINLEYDPDADGERSAQAEEDIQAAVEYYRRWVAVPPTEGNELSPPIRELTPFSSPWMNAAYQELTEVFLKDFPGRVYLNATTGLPSYMFCHFPFQLGDLDDPKFQAAWLMEKFALALSGRNSGETSVVLTGDVRWQDAFAQTRHLRYTQRVANRIPVWGGCIDFTFDSTGRLALITNSLYPVSNDELANQLPDFSSDWVSMILAGDVDGMMGVPKNIGFDSLSSEVDAYLVYFPYQPRNDRFDLDHSWEASDGEWRMPLSAADAPSQDSSGEYRPAWEVRFVDRYEQPWIGLVDVTKYGLLHWFPARRQAAVNYAVFASTQEALAFEAPLTGGNVAAIEAWINQRNLKQLIWLGTGVQTLRQATRVHLHGDRLKDSEDGSDLPIVAYQERERYLGANIMHHLKRVQAYFRGIFNMAVMFGWQNDQLNPLNNIDIYLHDSEGRPEYDPGTRALYFPKGKQLVGHPVQEPGFDGEVIAHEFTHAVMHAFFGRLFITNNTEAWKIIVNAFDEGLAFYFACDFFKNEQWAEYAYAAWQPWRNLAAVDLNYDNVVGVLTNPFSQADPAGVDYALGMWWARVLWEFRQRFPAFNAILLLTLNSLSSLQPTTHSAGDSLYEQIRDAFRITGVSLRDHLVNDTGNPAVVASTRQQAQDILSRAGIEPL
jgi:hypothetical protein